MECSTDYFFLGSLIVGLWDGLIAIVTLVVSLFFDVDVYNVCRGKGWFYNFGFLAGVGFGIVVGINSFEIFLIVFILAFIVYLAVLLSTPIMWGVGIALGCLVVYGGYKLFLEDRINRMRGRP